MALPTENWFYARGGQQTGPVSLEQLQNLLLNGHVDRDRDLVWAQGLEDWKTAAKIEGLVPTRQDVVPYEAPGLTPDSAQAGPPVPYVKRASFGLLMLLGGAGMLCFVFGAVIFGVTLFRTMGTQNGTEFSVGAIVALLVVFAGIGLLIAAMVFFCIYLYRAWLVLQPYHVSLTPGIAVGLCFVPFFNLYWMFKAYHGWAVDYTRVISTQPAFQLAPRVSVGLFLTFCILTAVRFPFALGAAITEAQALTSVSNLLAVVSLILFLVVAAQICSAVNYFAGFHTAPQQR